MHGVSQLQTSHEISGQLVYPFLRKLLVDKRTGQTDWEIMSYNKVFGFVILQITNVESILRGDTGDNGSVSMAGAWSGLQA